MGIHVTVRGRFPDDTGKVHSSFAADGGRLKRAPVPIVDQPNVHATICELRCCAIGSNRRDDVAVPAQTSDQTSPEMPVGAGNEDSFEHADNDNKVWGQRYPGPDPRSSNDVSDSHRSGGLSKRFQHHARVDYVAAPRAFRRK